MPTPTYKLLTVEFRNGQPRNVRSLGFRKSMLEHKSSPTPHVVITNVETPDPIRAKLLKDLAPYEISAIRYEIQADGKRVPFCHPFPKGTGVMLYDFINPTPGQRNQLFLQRADGRRFFSDKFTLDGVSNGRIPSNDRAYQFHE